MHRTGFLRLLVGLALALACPRPVTAADDAQSAGASGQDAFRQGHYVEAERLFAAALRDGEAASLDPIPLAVRIEKLATVRKRLGQYADAEALWRRALALREAAGPDVGRAADLDDLADVAALQGRYDEAESLAARSMSIKEAALGPDHPSLAASLAVLGAVARTRGRDSDAAWLYRHALDLEEKQAAPSVPATVVV